MNKSLLKEMIKPAFDGEGDIALQRQSTLRKLVGILGMLLPIVVYLFLQLTDNFNPVLPSISHYYFTRSSSFFVIILSILAIFLLIYKGQSLTDYYVSGIAGISALLVIIFPTNNLRGLNPSKFDSIAVSYFSCSDFRPKFHYLNASVFLLLLAFMSYFIFTKSACAPAERGRQKIIRNRIYRVCGIIMLLALLIAFAGFINIVPADFYDSHNLTFWTETVTVEAFGFSWLVKGGVFFADRTSEVKDTGSGGNAMHRD